MTTDRQSDKDNQAKKDKQAKKERKLSRKVEKGTLNSKTAAKQAEGWALLRFDLADADHATFARSHGIESAPAFLMWLPGQDAPWKTLSKGDLSKGHPKIECAEVSGELDALVMGQLGLGVGHTPRA